MIWLVGFVALYPLCFLYRRFKRKTSPDSIWLFFDIKIFFCGGCYLPYFVNQSPGILKYNKDNFIYIKIFFLKLYRLLYSLIFKDDIPGG